MVAPIHALKKNVRPEVQGLPVMRADYERGAPVEPQLLSFHPGLNALPASRPQIDSARLASLALAVNNRPIVRIDRNVKAVSPAQTLAVKKRNPARRRLRRD